MSKDTIYRQDAIDALDGEITVTGRANAEAVRGYARLVADRLKRLPSAQPEPIKINIEDYNKEDWERFKKEWGNTPITVLSAQPEIIRCKECKYCEHWYADKGRCFLWHESGIDVFEDGFCNYAERRTDG